MRAADRCAGSRGRLTGRDAARRCAGLPVEASRTPRCTSTAWSLRRRGLTRRHDGSDRQRLQSRIRSTCAGTKLQVGFDVEESHVGDLTYDNDFQMQKGDTTVVTLPLQFTWNGLAGAAQTRARLRRAAVHAARPAHDRRRRSASTRSRSRARAARR